ncbi:hypothetical protein [Pullulanibacillus camelliae]|uniref:hypothetical protein n=1 Tax=Pullulanibacillus camelliae TaxID=1707096 RepID=UPI00166920C2|nr:hypothetical protein [Pullulanibacillus camelliae]
MEHTQVFGGITSSLVIYCTVISFLTPLTLWRINEILHQKGDPPWKKEDKALERKQSHTKERS